MLLHVVRLHSFVLESTSRTSLLHRPEERSISIRHRPHSLTQPELDPCLARFCNIKHQISTIPPVDRRAVKLSGKKIISRALRLKSCLQYGHSLFYFETNNTCACCAIIPNAIQKPVSQPHHIGDPTKHLHSKPSTVPGYVTCTHCLDGFASASAISHYHFPLPLSSGRINSAHGMR